MDYSKFPKIENKKNMLRKIRKSSWLLLYKTLSYLEEIKNVKKYLSLSLLRHSWNLKRDYEN